MVELDRIQVEIPCPAYGFYSRIFFRQARLRDVDICGDYKANIRLDDHMNECRKAVRSVRRALAD
jgi:hypothetical protein